MTEMSPQIDIPRPGSVASIDVEQIDASRRIRQVDHAWVEAIAESMRSIGQQQPVEVRWAESNVRYALIAGGHRLAAARLLSWTHIDARLVEADDLSAELREIDENLFRHELSPLDRAISLARRQEIWEELHPESTRGGDRGNQHTGGRPRQTVTITFCHATASHVGLNPRTIRRATNLYRSLSPAVRSKISGTPLARQEGELYRLSRLPASEQVRVVELLQASDGPRKVTDAVAQINGHKKNALIPTDRAFQKLVDAWERAPKAAQVQFLDHLRATGRLGDR